MPATWELQTATELRTLPRPVAIALATCTGILLFSAFPPLEWAWAAWLALVPLGLAVAGRRLGEASALSFWAGLVFWIPSLWWIHRVTIAGWIALSAYCALYMIPPAWVFAELGRRSVPSRPGGSLGSALAIAATWVGWEVVRGRLATGFPWNDLGVSQYRHWGWIQHAAWGGVPAVSVAVAFFNGLAWSWAWARMERVRPPTARAEHLVGGCLLLLAWLSGLAQLATPVASDVELRVALVQPAVPQNEKWTPESYTRMYQDLQRLSLAALALQPSLLVWPETALPENVRESREPLALVHSVTSHGVPLVFGALDAERDDDGNVRYYNAAILMKPELALEVYRKQHLVLFGEYVPFRSVLPVLGRLVPMDFDLTPGHTPTVFRIQQPAEIPFSTMICFEDTMAPLARRFVQQGARWLLVLTNDAWFDGTWGHRQHFVQSIFRAVECGVPLVRCANSGVTGWVDPKGRIGGRQGEAAGTLPITDAHGRPVMGFLTVQVPIALAGWNATPWVRHGPWFPWTLACIGVTLTLVVAVVAYKR